MEPAVLHWTVIFVPILNDPNKETSQTHLVTVYSASPLWIFLAVKVPIQPLNFWPHFQVTKSGLLQENITHHSYRLAISFPDPTFWEGDCSTLQPRKLALLCLANVSTSKKSLGCQTCISMGLGTRLSLWLATQGGRGQGQTTFRPFQINVLFLGHHLYPNFSWFNMQIQQCDHL